MASTVPLLINGRFLARQPTGVDRFALETLGEMIADQCVRDRMALGLPAALSGRPTRAPSGIPAIHGGRFDGNGWEQLSLPGLSRDRFLVNLCNTGPMLLREQLVVIHDAASVATPQNYSRAFRSWYRALHHVLLRRSRLVATVSRFSADELARHHGVSPGRFIVLPESGEHIVRTPPDRTVLEAKGLTGKPFILAVGSMTANKNFRLIVEAMQRLGRPDVPLVAVGRLDPAVFNMAHASASGFQSVGYVTDAQLRALYEAASCFVFPSFYEGFGLPPLEAMTCGCPTIVSNRASMPEVCGNAALYCDPDDAGTLATQLQRLLGSRDLQADLIGRGRERAAQFRWADTGRIILDAIEGA